MYHAACDMLRDCHPKVTEAAEEAEPDALACPAFPPAHWKRLRTNNVQERANREIKRRSRVVQVFPSERSLERLVGAVMCEQDEQRSASRYFAYDKMQEPYDERRRKEPEAPGRPAADLAEEARKMILAILELAEKVDTAQHGRLDSGFGRRPKPLAVPIRRSLGLPSAAPSENGLHQHSRRYRTTSRRHGSSPVNAPPPPPVHALARPPAHNLQPSSSRHERHSLRYMQSQPRRCTAPQKTHLARLGNPPTASAKQPVISYQAVQPNDQDYPLYTEP